MSIGKNLIFVSSAEQEGLLIGHCQKIFASFSEELKAKVIEDLKNSDIKSLEIRPKQSVLILCLVVSTQNAGKPSLQQSVVFPAIHDLSGLRWFAALRYRFSIY